MKNPLENLQPKIIGSAGVDSGLIWIGDPCYILHQGIGIEAKTSLGRSWGEFCDTMKGKMNNSYHFNKGHDGLGVCTSTKHGDGHYNVIGFFEKGSDRPSCVLIDFDNVFNNIDR